MTSQTNVNLYVKYKNFDSRAYYLKSLPIKKLVYDQKVEIKDFKYFFHFIRLRYYYFKYRFSNINHNLINIMFNKFTLVSKYPIRGGVYNAHAKIGQWEEIMKNSSQENKFADILKRYKNRSSEIKKYDIVDDYITKNTLLLYWRMIHKDNFNGTLHFEYEYIFYMKNILNDKTLNKTDIVLSIDSISVKDQTNFFNFKYKFLNKVYCIQEIILKIYHLRSMMNFSINI